MDSTSDAFFSGLIIDGIVKSTNHVILNEVRMKNLSQLSTRFFVASLPQNDSFGSFYETIKYSKEDFNAEMQRSSQRDLHEAKVRRVYQKTFS